MNTEQKTLAAFNALMADRDAWRTRANHALADLAFAEAELRRLRARFAAEIAADQLDASIAAVTD